MNSYLPRRSISCNIDRLGANGSRLKSISSPRRAPSICSFWPIDWFLLNKLSGLAGFGDIFVRKKSRRENIRSGFLLSQT